MQVSVQTISVIRQGFQMWCSGSLQELPSYLCKGWCCPACRVHLQMEATDESSPHRSMLQQRPCWKLCMLVVWPFKVRAAQGQATAAGKQQRSAGGDMYAAQVCLVTALVCSKLHRAQQTHCDQSTTVNIDIVVQLVAGSAKRVLDHFTCTI